MDSDADQALNILTTIQFRWALYIKIGASCSQDSSRRR
jgi:hypothetical protein